MIDSKRFFKVKRVAERIFLWKGHDIILLGGNRVVINNEDYDLTPENETIITVTKCNFNNIDMDDESLLTFDNILKIVQYNRAKDSNST